MAGVDLMINLADRGYPRQQQLIADSELDRERRAVVWGQGHRISSTQAAPGAGGRGDDSAYLSPVVANPCTKNRWKARNRTTNGATEIKVMAIRAP